jgi:hypothetical protein
MLGSAQPPAPAPRAQRRAKTPPPFPIAAQTYRDLHIPISNEIWRAPLAASSLGGLLVLLFNILSCCVLMR